MKKCLILLLFLVSTNLWGQSAWLYDRQWSGTIKYEGSGRAKFDDITDLHNYISASGKLRIIERLSNEQLYLIRYVLQQYNVKVNDVYTVQINNHIYRRSYIALVIIDRFNNDGSNTYSYFFYEFFKE